jgi:branched-chain amino acid transport system substrate-binding protein
VINDQAGINSRKINFISNDDGYSPPKAVEQVRRLVESDEVRAIFSPMGVPSNTAIQKYLNGRKIPHLFPPSSASKVERAQEPFRGPWGLSDQGTSARARSTQPIS